MRAALAIAIVLALAQDIPECLAPYPMDKLAVIAWSDDGELIDPSTAWVDKLSEIIREMIRRGGFGTQAPYRPPLS